MENACRVSEKMEEILLKSKSKTIKDFSVYNYRPDISEAAFS
jgi:hypothetical protein